MFAPTTTPYLNLKTHRNFVYNPPILLLSNFDQQSADTKTDEIVKL